MLHKVDQHASIISLFPQSICPALENYEEIISAPLLLLLIMHVHKKSNKNPDEREVPYLSLLLSLFFC